MLDDIKAFLVYIASKAFQQTWPRHIKLDLHKIVVHGVSAGGYLARLTAILLTEGDQCWASLKCRGFISYSGMGGNFLSTRWKATDPSTSISSAWTELRPLVSRFKHNGEVSDVGYSDHLLGWELCEARSPVWLWAGKHGLLLDLLVGHFKLRLEGNKFVLEGSPESALTIREKLHRLNAYAEPLSKAEALLHTAIPEAHRVLFPQLWFAKASNCAKFPPAFFIHGTADNSVHHEETVHTYRQLTVHSSPHPSTHGHVFKRITGADHELYLERSPGNLNRAHGLPEHLAPDLAAAHEALVAFIASLDSVANARVV